MKRTEKATRTVEENSELLFLYREAHTTPSGGALDRWKSLGLHRHVTSPQPTVSIEGGLREGSDVKDVTPNGWRLVSQHKPATAEGKQRNETVFLGFLR